MSVWEVHGVSDGDTKPLVRLMQLPNGVHIETRGIGGNALTPTEARYVAKKLNRLARLVEEVGKCRAPS